MKRAQLRALGDGAFALSGELDFSTVPDLLQQGSGLFKAHRDVRLDLAGVTHANSAGLAVLMEWLDLARRRGGTFCIVNLPDSLAAIADMSNVRDLLPLRDGGPASG